MLLIVVTLSTLVSLAHLAPHGCSHDGSEYRVNQIITIGCDECVCLPGHIKCPATLKCPRQCFYKGNRYDHGTKWYNDETCDNCECDDGSFTCINRECPDKCSVNGMNYDVGEKFKKDCEMCTCYGNDIIHCEEKDCPCFINNNIVFHNDVIELGRIVYRCVDGRMTEDEDNRVHGVLRYLTTAEIKELEMKLLEKEKREKLVAL